VEKNAMNDKAMRGMLVTAFAVLAAACGGPSPETQGRGPAGGEAIRVVTQAVVHERERTDVEAVGTARARATAMIYPEAGGVVTDVPLSAGTRVEQGDILLQLNAREERLAVQLARVAVEEAEQLLARYRRIENTGAISASQIDEARTALDAARIQLEQAQVALDERTVRAPFAGHVGLTDVDPGSRITPQTPIAQLDDRSVLFVDFTPAEQVFGRLQEGDTVLASPFASPESAVEAEVIAVDSRIDPTRRTFTVRARIDNADDVLRPGMSFRVGFTIEGQAYPRVPEAAIIWGGSGAYVWGVDGDRAFRIPVSIVSRSSGFVLVDAPIPPGSRIVTEGVQKVREGSRILDLADREAFQAGSGGGAPVAADETR
jgi:RND family efflux transporter MFP subunit